MTLILKIAAGIIVAAVLLTVGCGVLVSAGSNDLDQQLAQASTEQARAASWEWIDKPRCGSTPNCWQITVTSRDGCPDGLYAELNILDKSGTVIDYTNDTLGSLDAGGSAVLTFDYFSGGAAKGQVTEVNCY